MKEEITGDYSFLLKQSIFRIGEVSSVDGREIHSSRSREESLSYSIQRRTSKQRVCG